MSGLVRFAHRCIDDHGSLVILRSASVRPKHLFDPYFDHDYFFKLPSQGAGCPIKCTAFNHGIDEAVRGVQRLKKSPKLFMETYHKSMAGLERRRSIINLQFMLEMHKLEEDDESRFEEEFNVWLSDEPLAHSLSRRANE